MPDCTANHFTALLSTLLSTGTFATWIHIFLVILLLRTTYWCGMWNFNITRLSPNLQGRDLRFVDMFQYNLRLFLLGEEVTVSSYPEEFFVHVL